MNGWEQIIVLIVGMTALTFFVLGFYQCKYKDNSYGSFLPLNLIGAFVWGDAVVLGLFWMISSAIVLYLSDFLLFLLIVSVFWVVRSSGEVMYWFLEQFTSKPRNSIDSFPFFKRIFHNDSIWFVYQVYWQCILIFSLISTFYITSLWLDRL